MLMDSESFTEEQLVGERILRRAGVSQPTFSDLMKAMQKYGPDGILESALHLSAEEYDELEKEVKARPKAKKMRLPRK